MISADKITYLELSEIATHELVLLISLDECCTKATAYEILHNIQQKGYFRHSPTRLSYALSNQLVQQEYVYRENNYYHLTHQGKIRLRDLCELAWATPSSVAQLTTQGFKHVNKLRHSLGIFPFTNGQLATAKPRSRKPKGYSVYAILLKEQALQRWYQVKNSRRNPKLPCVYIGMTSQTPLARFDEHRFGPQAKGSQYVYFFGLCLMPYLYTSLNEHEMTREEALKKESLFAESLRHAGFAIFAGHHDIVLEPRKEQKHYR